MGKVFNTTSMVLTSMMTVVRIINEFRGSTIQTWLSRNQRGGRAKFVHVQPKHTNENIHAIRKPRERREGFIRSQPGEVRRRLATYLTLRKDLGSFVITERVSL